MGEGHVGEIFNSLQGEGPYVGKRQVFIRFAGCSLRCVYCDTVAYRNFRPPFCRVWVRLGKFTLIPNPLSSKALMNHVNRLVTPDLHSVSLTGGEPLEAGEFLIDVARACKRAKLKTYLETNGTDRRTMDRVAPYIDFASIDVKLPGHEAVSRTRWPKLFEAELGCLKVALSSGLRPFVKVVVLGDSYITEFKRVCERLAELEVPLVIQPVTARKGIAAASVEKLLEFSKAAAGTGVRDISIIPQAHKLLRVK